MSQAGRRSNLTLFAGDEDSRNTVSGAQVFEGEDLLAGERRKLQVAQQAAWCAVQTAEKSALKAHEAGGVLRTSTRPLLNRRTVESTNRVCASV